MPCAPRLSRRIGGGWRRRRTTRGWRRRGGSLARRRTGSSAPAWNVRSAVPGSAPSFRPGRTTGNASTAAMPAAARRSAAFAGERGCGVPCRPGVSTRRRIGEFLLDGSSRTGCVCARRPWHRTRGGLCDGASSGRVGDGAGPRLGVGPGRCRRGPGPS